MKHLFRITCVILMFAVCSGVAVSQEHSNSTKGESTEKFRLWFYLPINLLVDENVDRAFELMQRAADAGYNGVYVTDSKFYRWDDLPDRYAKNVKRFREECRRLNLDCFAGVCSVGYSNDLLSRDPNLAEGMPVVDAPFIVRDGRLVPDQSESLLKNGGFEQSRNNKPVDWGFVDAPGEITFIDDNVKCEGKASLRMQNIGPDEPRNGRAMQQIAVKPFQYYHVSVMLKTEDFDAANEIRITVLAPDGMSLNWHIPPIKRTQDWTRVDITFNSLANDSVNLYFGVWGGRRGTIWWDDVNVEPGGFVNVLRRDGAPLKIKSENSQTEYVEGRDFNAVVDPKLGNDPYGGSYTAWHESPVIRISENSRLREGDRVLASYTHASIVYEEQVCCCMSEPKVLEILKWQIEQVCKNLEPDGYFMNHDEIRQTGWDQSCVSTGKTPAQILGDNVAACVALIRETDPGKPITVWSDMFDPSHNAQKDGHYYLVKGTGPWFGSWEKLPTDVIVVNWNSNPAIRGESLKHFNDLGNMQILAGYYDAEPIDAICDWMQDAAKFDGFCGVMYTTWGNNYDHLEAFAESVRKEIGKSK